MIDDRNIRIEEIFAPIIGHPAWGVKQGHASFLDINFGSPYLATREPIVASPSASDKVRRNLARRRVWPRGHWHLMISFCCWRVELDKEIIAYASPQETFGDAAVAIDGQILTHLRIEPEKGASTFLFDQGASLTTWPMADDLIEQWTLYIQDGPCFTYTSSGACKIGANK